MLYLCLEDTFCRIQDRLFRLTDEASGRLISLARQEDVGNGGHAPKTERDSYPPKKGR